MCPMSWFKTSAPDPNFGPSQETSSHKSWNTFSELVSLALKILLLIYFKGTTVRSTIFKKTRTLGKMGYSEPFAHRTKYVLGSIYTT